MNTVPRFVRYLLAALALGMVPPLIAQEAPSITIQVTPTSGVESVTPTITWEAKGVKSCTATGGWAGNKPLTGTETLPAIDRSAIYGLVCVTTDGRIVITWQPPTQNTNGTPLTDLAGFKVYQASTEAGLRTATPVPVAGAAKTSLVVDNAPVGMVWTEVTAYNAAGVESDRSARVAQDVKQVSTTAQQPVEVKTKPNPPTATAIENGTN